MSDVEFLKGFHDDDPAALAEELRKGLARGDFQGVIATWRAKRTLRLAERMVVDSQRQTMLGAALRQARAAEESVLAAFIAIGISLVALAVSVFALLKP